MLNAKPDGTAEASEYLREQGATRSKSWLEKARARGDDDPRDKGPDYWVDEQGRVWYYREELDRYAATSSRPRPRHRHDLGALLAALRVAHTSTHSLEGRRCSAQARQRFGFGDPSRPALAGDLHEEVTECVVKRLDVPQQPHSAASCGRDLQRVHAVPAQARDYTTPFPDLLEELPHSGWRASGQRGLTVRRNETSTELIDVRKRGGVRCDAD